MSMRSELQQLLKEVSQLPKLQQRKVGCLVGAAVGDAAARPLHWVYDVHFLQQTISTDPQHPEFWPESKSPFYTLPTGDNSCYWDQAMAVATSLGNRGGFVFEDICQELVTQFGPQSAYNMDKRQEYMLRRMQGLELVPLQGKWLHGGMIKFLENHSRGQVTGDPTIKETDGFCCALPVVAKYAGNRDLVDMVTQVTQTQSTWPVAVHHAIAAARIVEAFIHGDEDPLEDRYHVNEESPQIVKEIDMIKSTLDVNHTEAVGRIFGRPCYNPGSWMGAIHAVLSSSSFAEAIRKTIVAGGCNCSRSFFIGAMMGAKHGVDGIPTDWLEKTHKIDHVLRLAMKITS